MQKRILSSYPTGEFSIAFLSTVKPSNIVSTVNMKKEINLPEVVDKLRNTEYNPKVWFWDVELTVKRFDAMIMRIREPKCTALVFKSGKVVLAGTKSTKDTEAAGRRVVDILSVALCFCM